MTHPYLDFGLDVIEDPSHPLLEPPSPAYSNVTVRRAFITWMHCGQRNSFQKVCDYYHYLEAMEDTLTAEQRAMSRHPEFHLFSNQPPTSHYLESTFPGLYVHRVEPEHIKKLESVNNEHCIFKLEGFSELSQQKAKPEEIAKISRVVRDHCRTSMIPIRRFFNEFKKFANICQLKYTVKNVAYYISRKMIKADLQLVNNTPKTFSFLETTPRSSPYGSLENFNTGLTKPDAPYIVKQPSKFNKGLYVGRDVKLNSSCAAFFNSFNVKYVDNKTVPRSPLVNNCNNTCAIRCDKLKSRSVESLICKNFPLQNRGYSNSSYMNFDDFVKQKRIY